MFNCWFYSKNWLSGHTIHYETTQ